MGIVGFWSFYSSLVKTVPINQIEGKIAVIDIVFYIHKYVIGLRKCGTEIKSDDGKDTIHLFALTKIIKNFTDKNILPICVFDGKSPLLKSEVVEKRKELIELSKEKCETLKNNNNENSKEYIKHFKRSFNINSEILNDCRDFLTYSGIPYVDAIGEADPQCAVMAHYYSNVSPGVFSEDSDILLYGAPALLRDFNIKKNKCVSVIEMNDVLRFLQEKTDYICIKHEIKPKQFTRDNFIDFSIIMGNDYCAGIKYTKYSGNVNREKIFELFVLSNFNVETFIEMINVINQQKNNFYNISDNFISKWKEIKHNYIHCEIIDPTSLDIFMTKPMFEEIHKFLERFNFRQDVIRNVCSSLQNIYTCFNNSMVVNKTIMQH